MRVRFRSRLVALDTKGSNGAHGGSRERIVTVRRRASKRETGKRKTKETIAEAQCAWPCPWRAKLHS